MCLIDLKDRTTQYNQVLWYDRNAKVLAQVATSVSANAVASVTDEYLRNTDSYMNELVDAVAENIQAQRRLFQSQLQLSINTGREDEARQMEFEVAQADKMVPVTMFLSGDSTQVSVMCAADCDNLTMARQRF